MFFSAFKKNQGQKTQGIFPENSRNQKSLKAEFAIYFYGCFMITHLSTHTCIVLHCLILLHVFREIKRNVNIKYNAFSKTQGTTTLTKLKILLKTQTKNLSKTEVIGKSAVPCFPKNAEKNPWITLRVRWSISAETMGLGKPASCQVCGLVCQFA